MKINIVSGTMFSKVLAKRYGYDYDVPCWESETDYDHIHVLGVYKSNLDVILNIMNKNPKSTVSVHWLGSDIRELYETYSLKVINNLKEILFSKLSFHYTQKKEGYDILNMVGIENKLVPQPVDYFKQPVPLNNDRFTIGVYMPETSGKYCYNIILKIVKLLPQVDFIFYGNRRDYSSLPNNVTTYGWVKNIREVVEKCNAHVRITPFDGFGNSLIDFSSAKRDVIHNHDFPNIIKVDTINPLEINKSEQLILNCVDKVYGEIIKLMSLQRDKSYYVSDFEEHIKKFKYLNPEIFQEQFINDIKENKK